MTADEYKNAIGGSLKLKGGSISKTKKKKKKKINEPESGEPSKDLSQIPELSTKPSPGDLSDAQDISSAQSADNVAKDLAESGHRLHKTEAEKKFEENRRKLLQKKIEKEGVKSHKENVEEYNRKLHKQSDHNDMQVLASSLLYFRCLADFFQATNRTWIMKDFDLVLHSMLEIQSKCNFFRMVRLVRHARRL
jgi:protein FAM32A